MFGAGLVLYVAIQSEVHLDHILFGDMLGISASDIGQTSAIALVIALIIGLKWRDFLLHAFDPHQAKASGLRCGLLHYGLLCMIALTIVATLKAVGIILSISLLIAPGHCSAADPAFYQRAAAGGGDCVSCSLGGVWLSFYLDSAPAPTIVVLFTALFIITFVWTSVRDNQTQATSAEAPERLTPYPGDDRPHALSPGCAAQAGKAPRLFRPVFFRKLWHGTPVINQVANRQNRVAPEHSRPRPAHDLLHFFAFCRLVAVDRALLTGRLLFAKHAFIQPLIGIGVQRLIMFHVGLRVRAAALIERNHAADSLFPGRCVDPPLRFSINKDAKIIHLYSLWRSRFPLALTPDRRTYRGGPATSPGNRHPVPGA
jgi:hypothetical protein